MSDILRSRRAAAVLALGVLVALGALLWPARVTGGQETQKQSLPEVMKRMKYYNQALGVECDYCHVPGGKMGFLFELDTPRKKTAKWMQERLVDGLVTKDSHQPIDCLTCHEGRARFLPSSQ
jgi:hypothetical protein